MEMWLIPVLGQGEYELNLGCFLCHKTTELFKGKWSLTKCTQDPAWVGYHCSDAVVRLLKFNCWAGSCHHPTKRRELVLEMEKTIKYLYHN